MIPPDIYSSPVFLVSGGARGITAQCVIRLAQTYRCRWILLGRSPLAAIEPDWAKGCDDSADLKRRIMQMMQANNEKPTPMAVQKQFNAITAAREIHKTLETLDQLGNQAEYLSVDVAQLSVLQEKLVPVVARLGAVTGIIHGAGTLADKWIEKKTEEDFDNVYAAKVQGLENLLQCVAIEKLQYLVLFSSVAGFFGSAGQSDYALANEILNKSAHLIKQHYPHCHVVSINWGPWDSGMVTPELKRAFANRKIEVIPINIGTEMLLRELHPSHHSEAQVVIGSPLLPAPVTLDSQLHSYRIRRRLQVETNPVLMDHMIGGNPVLPATCAAHWMINLCEQLYPSFSFSNLENFKVLKGIVFDGSQADEYIADVQELAKTNSDEISFEVRIWSEKDKGKIRFHYSGQIKLRQSLPVIIKQANWVNPSHKSISGLSFYEDKVLFHGSAFQGIQNLLDFDESSVTLDCYLQPLNLQQQGQFVAGNFNPYAADVALQSILVWLKQIHGVSALPSEFQQVTQFKYLPFGQRFQTFMEVQIKTPTYTVCNLTTYGESGEVFTHFSGIKATLSDRLFQLYRSPISTTFNNC